MVLPPPRRCSFQGTGDFKRVQKPLEQKKKDYIALLDGVIHSIRCFNVVFKEYNVPFQMDDTEIRKDKKRTERLNSKNKGDVQEFEEKYELVAEIISGKFKGYFELEHVLTIVGAIKAYLEYGDCTILLWGACQAGKTMSFCGLFILIPVIEFLNGRRAIPLITMPNSLNLWNSAKKEMICLLELYKRVRMYKVGDEDNSKNLYYVRQEILNVIKPPMAGGAPFWDCLVLQRNNSNFKHLQKAIGSLVEQTNEGVVILFNDEVDHGSDQKSVSSNNLRLLDQLVDGTNIVRREVGVTATHAEISSSHMTKVVPQWINEKTYHGLITYKGLTLPTIFGGTPTRPEVVVIEDKWGHAEEFLDLDKFINPAYFYRNNSARETHEQYQMRFACWIVDYYVETATKNNPVSFARIFKEIKDSHVVLDLIEQVIKQRGLADKYKVYRYFDKLDDDEDNGHQRTVREVLIDDYINKGLFCLVVAGSGRSKRGDSYPKEVAHYLDLWKDSISWDTIIQFTYGRAMGNGKKSTCYFRRQYATQLEALIAKDCIDRSKKYNRRTDYGARTENVVVGFATEYLRGENQ